MRKRARIDSNQQEIVEALRAIGCSVLLIHQLGGGAPDLLVGSHRRNVLLEVKDGSKPPCERNLTEDEQIFYDSWRGQVDVVETVAEAIDAVRRNT